jgi:GNAT superfamily N-acetyltransferase
MDRGDDIGIRAAQAGDLDEVARVWHDSALGMEGLRSVVPPVVALRERLDFELADGWDLHVACADTRIVGMLALRPADKLLAQIFVAPGGERQGIGRRLLDEAKRRMPGGFTLWMVAGNDRARHFYQSQGLRFLRHGLHPKAGYAIEHHGWGDV